MPPVLTIDPVMNVNDLKHFPLDLQTLPPTYPSSQLSLFPLNSFRRVERNNHISEFVVWARLELGLGFWVRVGYRNLT
eukprot:960674-Amorphochlora_amoeboformis.AAC.1